MSIASHYIKRVDIKNEIQEVITQKANKIFGNDGLPNIEYTTK